MNCASLFVFKAVEMLNIIIYILFGHHEAGVSKFYSLAPGIGIILGIMRFFVHGMLLQINTLERRTLHQKFRSLSSDFLSLALDQDWIK